MNRGDDLRAGLEAPSEPEDRTCPKGHVLDSYSDWCEDCGATPIGLASKAEEVCRQSHPFLWREGALNHPCRGCLDAHPIPSEPEAEEDAPSDLATLLAEHQIDAPRGYAHVVCACGWESDLSLPPEGQATAHVAEVIEAAGWRQVPEAGATLTEDERDLAKGSATPSEPACCCECSPPEFGGNLPDRECSIHGAAPSEPEATVVEEWGVRYGDTTGTGKTSGTVESYGTLPGGDVGRFTEDIARYVAGSRHTVVRRTRTTYADRVTEWEEVDD